MTNAHCAFSPSLFYRAQASQRTRLGCASRLHLNERNEGVRSRTRGSAGPPAGLATARLSQLQLSVTRAGLVGLFLLLNAC